MDIVSLLEELVKGILDAEEKFFANPKDFYSLETAVKSCAEAFSAGFLGTVLSSMDKRIFENAWRKEIYNAQRKRTRSLISSVGDVTFDCTYYQKTDGSYHYLLEEIIGLGKHERVSAATEVMLLLEALKTSYAEAARSIPSKMGLTKTTVMNYVHGVAEEIPFEVPKEKRKCEYLHVEADEDHVAEQHGRWNPRENNKSFMSKIVYLYEIKKDSPQAKGRKELFNTFYFAGVYQGSAEIEKLWRRVQNYIDLYYDSESVKQVFVSGDGAQWIKSGAKYLDKGLFCADKYHLMQYINSAAGQMKDEKDVAKEELWNILYSKKKDAKERFESYTQLMLSVADKQESIQNLRAYVLGNWAAVKRTLHNKNVGGCSAESHVSHVLSDRLSSRPMAWSQTGADRMSKLRCYVRNCGREKLIDLVMYSRETRKGLRTGTDDMPVSKLTLREIKAEHYDQAKSYIERLQATIPGLTARKSASIRTQLRLL